MFLRRPCILEIAPKSDFTDVEWGAADRSAPGRQRPLSSKGRRTISKQSPKQLPGLAKPVSRKDGPVTSRRFSWKQESIYVGVDVSKAQMDVAIRPSDDSWVVANDDSGLRQLVSPD